MKDLKPTHVLIKEFRFDDGQPLPVGTEATYMRMELNGYGFLFLPSKEYYVLPHSYLNEYLRPIQENSENKMLLPTDAKERKDIPITTGVLDYFPLAIAEVAKLSKAGNDQHNPGQDLHWNKSKSTDHADCISRHLIDRGSFDTDGQRHSAKLAWRALALLQIELENEKQKGML